MKESYGFWFPDYDNHFPRLLAKSLQKEGILRYQWRARDAAIENCINKRVCIDIGANVGLWSCDLVKSFRNVVAFEPVEEFRECFKMNVIEGNYSLYPMALGNTESFIDMNIVEGNTGHSHVDPTSVGRGRIPLKTLDSFNFTEVDMIKIDVEGYERDILLGAEKTIKTNRPVMAIEQQTHEYQDDQQDFPCVRLLESWGYTVVGQFNKDWILKWL